jgi:hypothetical protein
MHVEYIVTEDILNTTKTEKKSNIVGKIFGGTK